MSFDDLGWKFGKTTGLTDTGESRRGSDMLEGDTMQRRQSLASGNAKDMPLSVPRTLTDHLRTTKLGSETDDAGDHESSYSGTQIRTVIPAGAGSSGEDDPQKEFSFPPGTVLRHASEYTLKQDIQIGKWQVGFRNIQIEDHPEIGKALKAIRGLDLSPEQQQQIQKSRWGRPAKDAWSTLERTELFRALIFSPNFQACVRNYQEDFFHMWGVEIGHETSCLTYPRDWQNMNPTQLYAMCLVDSAGEIPAKLTDSNKRRVDEKKENSRFGATFTIKVGQSPTRVAVQTFAARIFALVAAVLAGTLKDIDQVATASHLCANAHCQNPAHSALEDLRSNQNRDACRDRAIQWRKDGIPVPWRCGIHGDGFPQFFSQLMALTNTEKINYQLSLALGEPLESPMVDKSHPFPTTVSSFENFDEGFDFGVKDPSLNNLTRRFDGPRDEERPGAIKCLICQRIWAKMHSGLIEHFRTHQDHELFLEGLLDVAAQGLANINAKRSQHRPGPLKSAFGRLCTAVTNAENLDKAQALSILEQVANKRLVADLEDNEAE